MDKFFGTKAKVDVSCDMRESNTDTLQHEPAALVQLFVFLEHKEALHDCLLDDCVKFKGFSIV